MSNANSKWWKGLINFLWWPCMERVILMGVMVEFKLSFGVVDWVIMLDYVYMCMGAL
jgi:hypothetical protein